MKEIKSEAEKHHLVAGILCLDFANTLYGHGKTPIHEYLTAYRDLVIWSHRVGSLTDADMGSLLREAARRPAEAVAVFQRAIALRETIHRVFNAVAHRERPKPADVTALNAARTEAFLHSQIVQTPRGFSIGWNDSGALERMLWPIALSAAELLTSANVARVRQCDGCDWLFIDTSRNHLRRWCSMSACGNRAKVRRFIERKRRLALRR